MDAGHGNMVRASARLAPWSPPSAVDRIPAPAACDAASLLLIAATIAARLAFASAATSVPVSAARLPTRPPVANPGSLPRRWSTAPAFTIDAGTTTSPGISIAGTESRPCVPPKTRPPRASGLKYTA